MPGPPDGLAGRRLTGASLPTAESYASLRGRRGPNPLVVEALELGGARGGAALDVGAGPLNDVAYLLRAGMTVDAVDIDHHSVAIAAERGDPRLQMIHADIRDVPIARGAYSLVVAIHTLPFLPRDDVAGVLSSIVGGLAREGLLCGTFLGTEDAWAPYRPRMSFLSRAELDGMLSGLDPLVLEEKIYEGRNAKGEPKRWHVHRRICRQAHGDG